MASDITISSSVRNNLLSLQTTADLMARTQERLATGKKVTSALDNPTNFFTASALSSRSNDLANLLDSMSNGIKTLEAADNGLKAITKTVESMQATVRQARQDKSFKGQSFTVDAATIGTATLKNLSFSGGSVGAVATDIALNTPGTTAAPTTLAGTGADFTTDFAGGNVTVNGTTVAIRGDVTAAATTLAGTGADFTTDFAGGNVTVNGTTVAIRGDVTAVASSATGTGGSDLTGDPDLSALDGESITLTAGSDTVTYNFTAVAGGQGAALDSALTASGFTVSRTAAGLTASRADGVEFTITTSNASVDAALGLTGGTTTTNGTEAFDATAATVEADLDGSGLAGLTASVAGGELSLSLASGADVTLAGDDATLTAIGFAAGAGRTSTNGTEAFDATAATVEADLDGSGVTGLTASVSGGEVSLSLASGADLTLAGDDATLTAIGFAAGAGRASTNGETTTAAGSVKTVDALVAEINTALEGKVRATNDNGKLRIENLSTEELTIGGVGTDGEVDGSVTTGAIGGNDVRVNLISQFNDLRDQLNKLSDDASFNGINLLRGDKLTISFNETGTSTAEIQAKDADGINTTELSISNGTGAEFGDDAALDDRLAALADSLTTLRSQSSTFGSSLSIVQNRQEFTKSMMNTLQTGADNLTLADTNEEGANMLALQTRQQLSSVALSLASQADQSVLRLF